LGTAKLVKEQRNAELLQVGEAEQELARQCALDAVRRGCAVRKAVEKRSFSSAPTPSLHVKFIQVHASVLAYGSAAHGSKRIALVDILKVEHDGSLREMRIHASSRRKPLILQFADTGSLATWARALQRLCKHAVLVPELTRS